MSIRALKIARSVSAHDRCARRLSTAPPGSAPLLKQRDPQWRAAPDPAQ
jgi:hypothetical protein